MGTSRRLRFVNVMKEGLLGGTLCVSSKNDREGGPFHVLHAGLDLSRTRLDYCLLAQDGERVEVGAAAPDGDGLAGLARRVEREHGPVEVRAAIESMNGARFVHDTLERCGWEVEVADAVKVKGLAPLACKTDKIDAWVLGELSRRDLVPAIWLPSFELRAERERARWRLFLVRKRSSLKHRIHAQLLAFGHRCPVSDLFGRAGRELLARLEFPEPWRGGVLAAVAMIDDPDQQVAEIDRELKAAGVDHHYIPLLTSIPGSRGSSATRSPPRSATSTGSARPESCAATPACAQGSTSPAPRTVAASSPTPAPNTCAGR